MGPRPALPNEVATYNDYQRQRLLVKPGMTCYWQTCRNRDSITFDEWVDLDLWPAGTDRAKLNLQLEAINKLRNRVAHSERLFDPGTDGCSPAKVDAEMLALSALYRRKLMNAFTATRVRRRSRDSLTITRHR